MAKRDLVPWDFGGQKYYEKAWEEGAEEECLVAQELIQMVLGKDFVPKGIDHVVSFRLVADRALEYENMENFKKYFDWIAEYIKWSFRLPYDVEIFRRPPPFIAAKWDEMPEFQVKH
jgi:hypothetical protein